MNISNFVVIGIDYKEFSLEEREAFVRAHPEEFIKRLYNGGAIKGYVNLSTCLRCEFYLDIEKVALLKGFFNGIDRNKAFFYRGIEAIKYLFRVSCGFESIIKGEDQILSQVKKSYKKSMENEHNSKLINVVFNHSIAIGKKFRTLSRIGDNALSLEAITVNFLKEKVESLKDKSIFLIGIGELSRSVLYLLKKIGVEDLAITNRTYHKVICIKEDICVKGINYKDKYKEIKKADIIIGATSAPHLVIYGDDLYDIVKDGKKRLFLDLAVPRDIDNAIVNMGNTSLYNLDHIWQVYRENLNSREDIIREYEYLIIDELKDLLDWIKRREIYRLK